MKRDCLDITPERLTDGQMNLKREKFRVRELIRTCMGRVGPIAERKSMQLHEEQVAEADVIGDRELMEYALYNLLTNAVKYSPAARQVSVTAALDRGFLRLSVRDQGIGMDSKELKNIFRKFYRTKKAEASGEVGTGIGLSIVEQIVVHHGGSMEVESTPGRGSTFTMVIPAQAHVASESMSVRQEFVQAASRFEPVAPPDVKRPLIGCQVGQQNQQCIGRFSQREN